MNSFVQKKLGKTQLRKYGPYETRTRDLIRDRDAS